METKLLSLRYKTALELVAKLFAGKFREISKLPYIVHLVGVSHIVQQVSDNEDVHIAALLHDVLEDIDASEYSLEQMKNDFGINVTTMVQTVSHNAPKYGKLESRKIYLKQIKNGTIEACLVSAADLLHNAQDIVCLYETMPDEVRQVFGGERAQDRVWFWTERFIIFEDRLGKDHKLVQTLVPVLQRLKVIHKEIM